MSMNNGTTTPSDDPAVREAREKAQQSFIELSRKILDILPTLEESLEKMSEQLEELKLEASVQMFQDFGKALESIGNALPSVFFENEDADKMKLPLDNVYENIGALIGKYEAGEIKSIKTCLDTEVLPSFRSFRQELETALYKEFPPS